jgi:hypothetical protein
VIVAAATSASIHVKNGDVCGTSMTIGHRPLVDKPHRDLHAAGDRGEPILRL